MVSLIMIQLPSMQPQVGIQESWSTGRRLKLKKQLFYQGPFDQGTNNVGEFLALVHGLAFLKKIIASNYYTDSRTAMSWVKKDNVIPS